MKKIICCAICMMNQTYITLNNGAKIPQFGMGVYMVPEGEETKRAVLNALKMGYRHNR